MRDFQTKTNISGLPDTITATRFGSGEFNSIALELENAVTSSDQAIAPADGTGETHDQLSKALSIYGAGGAFYHVDTGAVNAYVLNPVSPKESPPAYFDGFTVIFEPGTPNTTASTVNISSLGLKSITYTNGNPLVGGELIGSCGIKYNLSDDRFELLFSSGNLAGIDVAYLVDSTQADQGASSTNPDTLTIFDIASLVGTTKNATAFLIHNPVAGNTTPFNFDTSLDLSSYPNLKLKLSPGARFTRTTGDETLTLFSPENLDVFADQQITAVNMLLFSTSGSVWVDWYQSDFSTVCDNAIEYAASSVGSPGGIVRLLGHNYIINDLDIAYKGISLIGKGIDLSILDFQGSSDGIVNTVRLEYTTWQDFTITAENNVSGSDVAIINFKDGLKWCEFKNIKIVGKNGVTKYGFLAWGVNPDNAATNGIQFNRFDNIIVDTDGTYIGSGPTLTQVLADLNNDYDYQYYVDATNDGSLLRDDVPVGFFLAGEPFSGGGAERRANQNVLSNFYLHQWPGLLRIDEGYGNVIQNTNFECNNTQLSGGTDKFIFDLLIRQDSSDSVTSGNVLSGASFEETLVQPRVWLWNGDDGGFGGTASPSVFINIFSTTSPFYPAQHMARITYSTNNYPPFNMISTKGWVINNTDPTDVNNSNGTAVELMGWNKDGVVNLKAFPSGTLGAGGVVIAGPTFSGSIQAVSNNGGASIVILDDSTAEFRVVKTANGSAFNQIFAIPETPRTNTTYEMRMGQGGTAAPSITWGTVDPTASGITASIGSIYCRTTNGALYTKTNTGDTDWTEK